MPFSASILVECVTILARCSALLAGSEALLARCSALLDASRIVDRIRFHRNMCVESYAITSGAVYCLREPATVAYG